jgi:ATP-dependent DNA helicase RecG
LSLKTIIPPSLAGKLKRLGIHKEADLLLHFPLRYDDLTKLTPIGECRTGQTVVTEAVVLGKQILYKPRRTLQVQLAEHSDSLQVQLSLRYFVFYPNTEKAFEVGKTIRVFGELRTTKTGLEMVHPKLLPLDKPLPNEHTAVYPSMAGMAQSAWHTMIGRALKNEAWLVDYLPPAVAVKYGLLGFASALHYLHLPSVAIDMADKIALAWKRIKFDELLAQQLMMRQVRSISAQESAYPALASGQLRRRLLAALPFQLTSAQTQVTQQILADCALAVPMQRLLQGDVGSGKTVVAFLAAVEVIEAGFQVAIMAPTEILAEQHYHKAVAWLAPLDIKTVWLSGAMQGKEGRTAREACSSGVAQLIIGTHALFQSKVFIPRLNLVVIDEQHRFGVKQRLALRERAKDSEHLPHMLMMSATPIPRSLAMSYYANLDVSVIDELPRGRQAITTKLVADKRRTELLGRVGEVCAEGGQAYWVCPLIEESEVVDLQNAEATFAALKLALPTLSIGLLHGRLPSEQKQSIMQQFLAHELDLLVSTTVIEVGVDVPNASLMVIEHAERFGLAQLHQLRGRVGRGTRASTCVLLYSGPLSENARARLKVIYETQDGFEIAQADLRIRGPGELLGAKQSGDQALRFADIQVDFDLLQQARDTVAELFDEPMFPRQAFVDRWFNTSVDWSKA